MDLNEPVESMKATRRVTTLALAIAKYRDVAVRSRGREAAVFLAKRFGHVVELYTGPKLGPEQPAGSQEVRGLPLPDKLRIRLRPGMANRWVMEAARHLEGLIDG